MKFYCESIFNKTCQVPLVVADLAHVNVEVIIVSEDMKKDKEFMKKKINSFPILETDEGEIIFEFAA